VTNQTHNQKKMRFGDSRVSRGQNIGHDRPTGNHTPVAGKGQQPAVDSQDSRYQETVILGGNT